MTVTSQCRRIALSLLLCCTGCRQLLGLDDVIAIDASIDTPPLDCPSGYGPIEGLSSKYRLTSLGDFHNAYMNCKAETNGATTHLVSLDGPDELMKLRIFGPAKWVGAVQQLDTATPSALWFTITGQPLDAELWMPSQPDDSGATMGTEDNTQNVGIAQFAGLDDSGVNGLLEGICECDGVRIDSRIESMIP